MVRAYKKNYHFIYKTTNLLNGDFYVGMHSTDNLNDGYIGSGKRLLRSVEKYGKENFKTEIIEQTETRELLVIRERELVNENLLKDLQCINIKVGGEGGGGWPKEAHSKGAINANKTEAKRKRSAEVGSRTMKRLHTEGKIPKDACKSFIGKTHSEETKQKMRDSSIGKHQRESNSQFGTCWITNLVEHKNLKIKKDDLSIWIQSGWIQGRKYYEK